MDPVKHRRIVLGLAGLVLVAFAVGMAASLLSHGVAGETAASAATTRAQLAKSDDEQSPAKPAPAAAKPAAGQPAVAPAAPAATAASGPPPGVEGWVEGVVGTPVAGGKVVVGGWAADRVAGAPVRKVEVLLDGKVVATANLGVERPDVVKAIGRDSYARAGWNAVLDLAGVAPGRHAVSAMAFGKDGPGVALDGARDIDVTPAS
jgi:hypothetical protein